MKTIRAFIWGSAIGAAIGLLFAPQRGEVTRAQLQERFNEWQNQAPSQIGSLSGKATTAIESGRQTINSSLTQAQSAANTAADKAKSATNTAADKAQQTTTPSI